MPLQSDLTLDFGTLDHTATSAQTQKINDTLIELFKTTPRWWEVGVEEYRRQQREGEIALEKPTIIARGKNISVPSREKGRDIPCRVMMPGSEHGESQRGAKGVFLHIHGGGWVLGSEQVHDPVLDFIANAANLAVISVGYRLAPEDPFPAGPEDCYDTAEWLVDNAESHFGAPFKFMGGESAGGHLSVLTSLHLLRTRPSFDLKGGLLLLYGAYDLSWSPSARNYTKTIVLSPEVIRKYMDAFLPGYSPEQRTDPSISPFYADLTPDTLGPGHGKKSRLPSALFLCGTEDCLLDDTLMMSVKWLSAGADTIVKLSNGAPHGFTLADPEQFEFTREGFDWISEWLVEKNT
ncbi:MAG: hypothetical protein M4579_000235 [Chaenotheca gracillima]|nr:MAG: hypothetical protein M4579_000235 [Chaenotheca gracillima]